MNQKGWALLTNSLRTEWGWLSERPGGPRQKRPFPCPPTFPLGTDYAEPFQPAAWAVPGRVRQWEQETWESALSQVASILALPSGGRWTPLLAHKALRGRSGCPLQAGSPTLSAIVR